MRFTRAVRRAEPGQGDGRAREHAEALRPPMLPRAGVIAVPDLFGIGVLDDEANEPSYSRRLPSASTSAAECGLGLRTVTR